MGEFERVTGAVLEALSKGEPVALATVVRVRGSAPRHTGARMLVRQSGETVGTVGGSILEMRVIEHAKEALRDRQSRLERYLFTTDDDHESVGLCGGEVEVLIEMVEPDPILYIIGAGHIAKPLSVMGHQLGMRVVVVDDRAQYASKDLFPDAEELEVVAYDEARDEVADLPIPLNPSCYVVVATWGWDEPALAKVLAADPPPAYIGLVGSNTKARVIRERLMARGFSGEAVQDIHSPIGLDLGAETPEEIALSILAEILLVRNRGTGEPLGRKIGHGSAGETP